MENRLFRQRVRKGEKASLGQNHGALKKKHGFVLVKKEIAID